MPSVDGVRRATVSFDQFLPARRMSVGVSATLRQSATGDYTGVRAGGGMELRWYWRANHQAALARQRAASMVGWFAGARVDLALDATHRRCRSVRRRSRRWQEALAGLVSSGLDGVWLAGRDG